MSIITPYNQTNELTVSEALPLDKHPAAVYLAGLGSDNSRRTQKQALGVIVDLLTSGYFEEPIRPEKPKGKGKLDEYRAAMEEYRQAREQFNNRCLNFDWAALRYQHAQAIRSILSERYSPSSANRMLSALRGTLKAAFLLDQISADDYQKAIMVESVIGETLPPAVGRALDPGEIAALMASCEDDPSAAGARDAAIIALAYSCGLRRAELVTLDLGDCDIESGRLIIRGKRNKERTAYLVNGAKRAMIDWLAIRGDEQGALFYPVNKGGKLTTGRMTTQAIYNMLKKRATEASVPDFSPHDLRRTFVSDMLDAGGDLETVSKMAGHASVTTTAGYSRRGERAKEKAAGLLHVPYRGRMV